MSKKPYPSFPLTAHPTGRWCKKVRGKTYYFGPLEDPQGALERWLDQKDLLLAGGSPRACNGLRLADSVNSSLEAKQDQVNQGLLSPKTWGDYHQVGKLLVASLGRGAVVESLSPDSFRVVRRSISKYAPSVQVRMVTITRMFFKWGRDTGLCKEVLYGPDFKPPSKKTLRLARVPRLFTANQIQLLLKTAREPLFTMILLGINGGLGNTDIGSMPFECWAGEDRLILPRQKTGTERIIPLWIETQAALDCHLKRRSRSNLMFLTAHGNPWVRASMGKTNDEISKAFSKLLVSLGMKQKGLGFYTLRHTFQTAGDAAKDPLAVSAIMGHVDSSISGHYREGIAFERLKAVTDHVHEWLFNTFDK